MRIEKIIAREILDSSLLGAGDDKADADEAPKKKSSSQRKGWVFINLI